MGKNLIQPKTLKGFRDFLPSLMIPRKKMIYKIEKTFESFGFSPIDTPILEYTEILLGKGGGETDKQLFRFNDNGGRDVTMRFDLTVPLARFMAQHFNELGMPFRAYHIGPVWRAENTHRGRYREFYQCDFDILGTTSNLSDIEIAQIIYLAIKNITGMDKFTIRFNNRLILNAFMKKLGLQEKSADVLRVIDKIYKETRDKLKEEFVDKVEITENQANEILDFVSIKGSNLEIIKEIESFLGSEEEGQRGISNLKEFVNIFTSLEIPDKCYQIDISIARGLDYYTGTVFETMLDDLPEIGSICSGGRYDNLASLYTNNVIPGVGASIGIDRLLAAMEELKTLNNQITTSDVLVTIMDQNYISEYMKIAKEIRNSGINCELFADTKKFDKQLKYANRKGHKVVVIAGSNEIESNTVNIKDMNKSENFNGIERNKLVEKVREILNK